MTEIPISDGKGGLLGSAIPLLLAVMYFPQEPEKQEPFVRAVIGSALFSVAGLDQYARSKILAAAGSSPMIFSLLANAGAAPALLGDAREAARRGLTAARVLSTIIRAEKMPALASVTRAVRLVMKHEGRGRTEVMRDWATFKGVAHLHLAIWIFNEEVRAERRRVIENAIAAAERDAPLPRALLETHSAAETYLANQWSHLFELSEVDNLLYALSLADKIRLLAERHVPVGSKSPLFGRDESVTFPADIKLGPVRLMMPALSMADIEELSSAGNQSAK